MTGSPDNFRRRQKACELAAEHLRKLAAESPENSRDYLNIAHWNERRGFWWKRKYEKATAEKENAQA